MCRLSSVRMTIVGMEYHMWSVCEHKDAMQSFKCSVAAGGDAAAGHATGIGPISSCHKAVKTVQV